jgi:hypothetical protein
MERLPLDPEKRKIGHRHQRSLGLQQGTGWSGAANHGSALEQEDGLAVERRSHGAGKTAARARIREGPIGGEQGGEGMFLDREDRQERQHHGSALLRPPDRPIEHLQRVVHVFRRYA